MQAKRRELGDQSRLAWSRREKAWRPSSLVGSHARETPLVDANQQSITLFKATLLTSEHSSRKNKKNLEFSRVLERV